MAVSDWINNIRWKYFTNNKSGLIFKELIGEFKRVEQMTENKRYIVKGSDDFFQHIEDTTLHEDKHEGTIDNIYQVVRRLNEQEETIQNQKGYILLLEEKLEENGIRLEPKDFD